MTEDFYDLLDVSPDASEDEIKRAFREQVRVYHPDHNDDDRARAQFTALKKAYDILGDPAERQAYDRMGHEDYVAKRTEGLPSPDVWRSSSDSGRSDASTSRSRRTSASERGSSRSARNASASGTTSNSSSRGRTTAEGSTDGGTATWDPEVTGVDALVRWWRRRNLAWPLIWTSVLVYIAGLGQFASANEHALRDVLADAGEIGPDPVALLAYLSSGRHGIETPTAFVAGLEVVEAPIAPPAWYVALAGLVVLSLALVVGVRLSHDRSLRKLPTTDETIVVALALAVVTGLVGGPLLAGTALMALLFGVIVYRTRRLPGWSPSYLYVVGVLAPTAGFVAAAAGHESLAGDLLAFVAVPLVAAIGLPVRVAVRKRYRR